METKKKGVLKHKIGKKTQQKKQLKKQQKKQLKKPQKKPLVKKQKVQVKTKTYIPSKKEIEHTKSTTVARRDFFKSLLHNLNK